MLTANGFQVGDKVEYTATLLDDEHNWKEEIKVSRIKHLKYPNCVYFDESGIVNCDIVELEDGCMIFDSKLTRINENA